MKVVLDQFRKWNCPFRKKDPSADESSWLNVTSLKIQHSNNRLNWLCVFDNVFIESSEFIIMNLWHILATQGLSLSHLRRTSNWFRTGQTNASLNSRNPQSYDWGRSRQAKPDESLRNGSKMNRDNSLELGDSCSSSLKSCILMCRITWRCHK